MQTKEVVFGITGSIGAYKAADVVRRLKEHGCGVSCVMTKEACQFITPLTLQALSGRPVYTELFRSEDPAVIHTTLADQADLVLVAPATANIIGKLSHGLADDLLSCVVLATTAPVLVAPAMNVHMYEHPTVHDNIARLKTFGYQFVGPDVGRLACGYEAIGHLAEVEEIVRAALKLLARPRRPAVGGTPRLAGNHHQAGDVVAGTPARGTTRSSRISSRAPRRTA